MRGEAGTEHCKHHGPVDLCHRIADRLGCLSVVASRISHGSSLDDLELVLVLLHANLCTGLAFGPLLQPNRVPSKM